MDKTITFTDGKGTLSNGMGTIVSSEVVSEKFVNHKDIPEPAPTPVVSNPTPTPNEVGRLGIYKGVTGKAGETNKEWQFDIEITPPEGKTFDELVPVANHEFEASYYITVAKNAENPGENDKYETDKVKFVIDPTSGVAHITEPVKLKSGETIVIELPADTTYTLMEYGANENGYKTTSEIDKTPEIKNGSISWGDFENNREETPENTASERHAQSELTPTPTPPQKTTPPGGGGFKTP